MQEQNDRIKIGHVVIRFLKQELSNHAVTFDMYSADKLFSNRRHILD